MIEVLQVPSEIEPVLEIYRQRDPQRVLEIGCWEGGTLRQWLASKPRRVVAVDLEHRRPDLYEEWCDEITALSVVTGDSQSDEVKAKVRALGPYDWIFIDGDHSYQAAMSDAELALRCAAKGAVLLFHDIADQEGNGPAQVWYEFGESYATESFIDPKHERWGHGIGVVYL